MLKKAGIQNQEVCTILVDIYFCQMRVCKVLHTPLFSSVKIAAAVGGLTKKASKINAYTPPHY